MATLTRQKTADPALASHYIKDEDVTWQPMSGFEGVEMKLLYQNENTGLFTGLFRLAAGATIPLHEHTDIEQTFVDRGMASIETSLAKLVSKEKMSQADADAALARVRASTVRSDASDCDLVVEAIPEIPELKFSTFSELDNICKPETILATNTYSYSLA